MTTSDRSRAGRAPLRRLAVWLVIAAALAVGLALYFRFGREISPVLGGGQ